jgi:hypothetical protein
MRILNEATRSGWVTILLVSAGLFLATTQPALARGTCSATARALSVACAFEVKDDAWEAYAICLNLPDFVQRRECVVEVRGEMREAQNECREQFEARLGLCEGLGEEPYDPVFDPADFDDDFSGLTNPNPHLPIAIGNVWEYEGGDETTRVEVLDKTKRIEGVTCIVVNDVVAEDGEVIEDTLDWWAQARDGTVHYCGELARDFEYFEGDNPMEAELVEIEGSFKAGRDGAKSGVLMMASPVVGEIYRQEWAPGDAEDAAEVLSTTYGYGEDEELDEFVPQELAELLCDGDCVVTRDFTPLEPDVEERKYYAPGIGLFFEVDPETGDTMQLVDCNFDPVCSSLGAD